MLDVLLLHVKGSLDDTLNSLPPLLVLSIVLKTRIGSVVNQFTQSVESERGFLAAILGDERVGEVESIRHGEEVITPIYLYLSVMVSKP